MGGLGGPLAPLHIPNPKSLSSLPLITKRGPGSGDHARGGEAGVAPDRSEEVLEALVEVAGGQVGQVARQHDDDGATAPTAGRSGHRVVGEGTGAPKSGVEGGDAEGDSCLPQPQVSTF